MAIESGGTHIEQKLQSKNLACSYVPTVVCHAQNVTGAATHYASRGEKKFFTQRRQNNEKRIYTADR